jgi:predicted nucleic-acid-binding protein
MIGIDTNLLLRLIVGDEPKQAIAARDLIRERCSPDDPGYVPHIVLVELAWTLSRAYRFPRDRIADAISQLLEMSQLEIEAPGDVIAALQDYRRGPTDFADCLLGRTNVTAGCSTTVTFDRKAAKLPGFELLKSA